MGKNYSNFIQNKLLIIVTNYLKFYHIFVIKFTKSIQSAHAISRSRSLFNKNSQTEKEKERDHLITKSLRNYCAH